MFMVISRSPVRMGVGADRAIISASTAKAMRSSAGEAPPTWETETRLPRVTPVSSAIRSARALASATAWVRASSSRVVVSSMAKLMPLTRTGSPPASTTSVIISPRLSRSRTSDAELVGDLIAGNLGSTVVAVVVLGVDVEVASLSVILVDVIVRKDLENTLQGGVGGV